jgi:actin-related protein
LRASICSYWQSANHCLLFQYLDPFSFNTYELCGRAYSFSLTLANILCQSDMTGVVVDIGDGAPQIVPVVNGYVIGSSIKSFPFSGSDVTQFVSQLLQVHHALQFLL